MDLTLWNAALSLVVGIVSWVLKDKATELSRISILLNKTREEIAKDYVTKTEVHADINRVMNRLEVLDAKLDRLIENIRVKGPTNG
jgi:archaellum component FlaC